MIYKIFAVIVGVLLLFCGISTYKNHLLEKQLIAQKIQNGSLEADNNKLRTTMNGLMEQLKEQTEKHSIYEKEAAKQIAELEVKSNANKTRIIKELVNNPSCENQLKLIKELQRRFYNVE